MLEEISPVEFTLAPMALVATVPADVIGMVSWPMASFEAGTLLPAPTCRKCAVPDGTEPEGYIVFVVVAYECIDGL